MEDTLTWEQAREIEDELRELKCRVLAHHDNEGFCWVSGQDQDSEPIRFDTLSQYERWKNKENL